MILGDLEYVMCSLPYLSFQDTDEERSRVFSILKKYAGPAESEQDIITILEKEAGKFLDPKAYGVFRQISLDTIHSDSFQQSTNHVLATFSKYVYALKKDVRQLRYSRRKALDSPVKKPDIPLIPGTPLEEEIQLLRWQWDKLEEISIGHYADFGSLCIYKLKLLLLFRWWNFDREKGFANFLNSTKTT